MINLILNFITRKEMLTDTKQSAKPVLMSSTKLTETTVVEKLKEQALIKEEQKTLMLIRTGITYVNMVYPLNNITSYLNPKMVYVNYASNQSIFVLQVRATQ